ncbi:MAG: hypothetical protein ABSE25_14050 [Syntrophorhabdales bacterium]|jgi:hypothetical protein
MKTILYITAAVAVLAFALLPASSYGFASGNPPWGAPVMPGGKVVKTEKTAIYIEYSEPHDKVLAWYREALKNHRDPAYNIDYTKYREWKDQTYIEDQGAADWHSIGISKTEGPITTVKIVRDNFTWIFSTLLIRFAGVFAVLCVLWILLNINSAVMKNISAKKTAPGKA